MKLTLELDGYTISVEDKDTPEEVWAVGMLLRRVLNAADFSTEEIETELGATPCG